MRIDGEDHSRVAQSFGRRLRFARPGRRHGDGVFDVQFALPSIVEQPERGVAVLLDFGENDAGADRVNGSGGNEDDVALMDRVPMHDVGDRAVRDRRSQLDGGARIIQSHRDLCAGSGGENVPCFGLAVGKPDRARKRIVRMNLNRERLGGEEQFEQQRRLGRSVVRSLKPQFPDRAVCRRRLAPRTQIDAAPRLRLGSHDGMFDRQDGLLTCGATD